MAERERENHLAGVHQRWQETDSLSQYQHPPGVRTETTTVDRDVRERVRHTADQVNKILFPQK